MSRTLKRPMFRRGGSTNTGIMSGLVDRTKHAENPFVTTVGQKASKLTPELEAILEQYTPKTRLPIGEFGLDIATGTPILDALNAAISNGKCLNSILTKPFSIKSFLRSG